MECCIMCRSVKNDGIIIFGNRICANCEKRISEADMESRVYEYYRLLIKEKIVKPMIRGECGYWNNYHL